MSEIHVKLRERLDMFPHIYADDFDLSLARSEDTGKAFPFE